MSYNCGIPKNLDMSALSQGLAVKQFCVKGVITGENISSGETAGERLVRETEMLRSRVVEIPRKN